MPNSAPSLDHVIDELSSHPDIRDAALFHSGLAIVTQCSWPGVFANPVEVCGYLALVGGRWTFTLHDSGTLADLARLCPSDLARLQPFSPNRCHHGSGSLNREPPSPSTPLLWVADRGRIVVPGVATDDLAATATAMGRTLVGLHRKLIHRHHSQWVA